MTTKTRVNGETTAPSLDELLSFAQESGLTEVVWEKGSRRIAFKRSVPPLIAVSPVSNGTHVAGAEKEGEYKDDCE